MTTEKKQQLRVSGDRLTVLAEVAILAGFAFIGAQAHIARGDWFSMLAFAVLILLLIRDLVRRVW